MLKLIILPIIICLPVISAFFAVSVHAETSVSVSLSVGEATNETSLTLSGLTSPKAVVTIMRDGAVVGTTSADDGGCFSLTLTAQTPGIKEYKIYATDRGGLNTSTIGYSINLTANATTSLDNIFLPPTMAMDKTKVKQGENIKFSGFSYPSSTVTILFSPNAFSKSVSVANSGVWDYYLETKDVGSGEYRAYAISTYLSMQSLGSSPFTLTIESVGAPSFLAPLKELLRLPEAIALFDPNKDGKIDISELFDVTSAWFKEFRKRFGGTCDLNNDGRCDVLDFSILLYHFHSE